MLTLTFRVAAENSRAGLITTLQWEIRLGCHSQRDSNDTLPILYFKKPKNGTTSLCPSGKGHQDGFPIPRWVGGQKRFSYAVRVVRVSTDRISCGMTMPCVTQQPQFQDGKQFQESERRWTWFVTEYKIAWGPVNSILLLVCVRTVPGPRDTCSTVTILACSWSLQYPRGSNRSFIRLGWHMI